MTDKSLRLIFTEFLRNLFAICWNSGAVDFFTKHFWKKYLVCCLKVAQASSSLKRYSHLSRLAERDITVTDYILLNLWERVKTDGCYSPQPLLTHSAKSMYIQICFALYKRWGVGLHSHAPPLFKHVTWSRSAYRFPAWHRERGSKGGFFYIYSKLQITKAPSEFNPNRSFPTTLLCTRTVIQ